MSWKSTLAFIYTYSKEVPWIQIKILHLPKLSAIKAVNKKSSSPEGNHTSYLARWVGKCRTSALHFLQSRNIPQTKRNHWKSVCGCKREARDALDKISYLGKNRSAYEANFCCHEFKEVGPMARERWKPLFFYSGFDNKTKKYIQQKKERKKRGNKVFYFVRKALFVEGEDELDFHTLCGRQHILSIFLYIKKIR